MASGRTRQLFGLVGGALVPFPPLPTPPPPHLIVLEILLYFYLWYTSCSSICPIHIFRPQFWTRWISWIHNYVCVIYEFTYLVIVTKHVGCKLPSHLVIAFESIFFDMILLPLSLEFVHISTRKCQTSMLKTHQPTGSWLLYEMGMCIYN